MKNNIKYIIEGCVQNNRACQTALFEMFYNKMFRLSLKYTTNEHQAQDIVQLSFIKIFSKISQYTHGKSLEGWILRIVTHTAIDEMRKDKFKNTISDIDVAILKVEETEYNEIPSHIIMDAVNELPPSCRAAFELYVLKDYPHKKIAEELKISEGTSKSNLFKAKEKLRKILKDRLKEEYFS